MTSIETTTQEVPNLLPNPNPNPNPIPIPSPSQNPSPNCDPMFLLPGLPVPGKVTGFERVSEALRVPQGLTLTPTLPLI